MAVPFAPPSWKVYANEARIQRRVREFEGRQEWSREVHTCECSSLRAKWVLSLVPSQKRGLIHGRSVL